MKQVLIFFIGDCFRDVASFCSAKSPPNLSLTTRIRLPKGTKIEFAFLWQAELSLSQSQGSALRAHPGLVYAALSGLRLFSDGNNKIEHLGLT